MGGATGHIFSDVIGNRPAFGMADRYFWSTDEHILYRDSGAAWVEIAKHRWTADKILVGAGVGASPIEIDPIFIAPSYPSDTIRNSNDNEKTSAILSYTKMKEMKLEGDAPSFRARFQLKSTLAASVFGQVYKNGNPVGTERNDNTQAYVEFTEDFTGWVKGDLFQIYGKAGGGGNSVFINNQRMSYELGVPATNQDP